MSRKTKRSVDFRRFAVLLVLAVIAFVIGMTTGILSDPLPPRLCVARMTAIGAPSFVTNYVCLGQIPVEPR